MSDEILVQVKLEDLMSGKWKTLADKTKTQTSRMRKTIDKVKASVFSLKGAVIGLGAAFAARAGFNLAKSFVDTAASVEQMQIRLRILLGDVEEANILFEDLATFAGKVPFELQEIMQSATMLAGVLKGGRAEVMDWMPLIADLAGAIGLSFQETAEQVQRMMSAGAASADRFRERGVLAMLGFKAGVSYSAEETKQKLVDEWNKAGSKFKGGAADMADSWNGKISMIKDAWFQFQRAVIKTPVFERLKKGLDDVIARIDEMKKSGDLERFAEGARAAFVTAAEGAIRLAQGIGVLTLAFKGMGRTFDLNKLDRMDGYMRGLEARMGTVRNAINALRKGSEDVPWSASNQAAILKLQGELKKMEAEYRRFHVIFEKTIESEQDSKDSSESLAQAISMLNDIVKDNTKAADDNAKAVKKEGETYYTAYSDIEKAAIKAQRANKAIEDARKTAALRAKTLSDAQLSAKAIQDEVKATTDLAAEQERVMANQETLRASYQAIGGTLKNNVLNVIDQAFEGTVNWREQVRGLLKDLAKTAIKNVVNLGFSAIGLAEGGVLPKGMGPLMPMRGYAEGGPIVDTPHVAMVGEGGGAEAVVPLTRGRKIPVEGGGGKNINISMNVNAFDSKSFADRLPEMKESIMAILLEASEENPAFMNSILAI